MFRRFSWPRLVTVSSLVLSALVLSISSSRVHATDGHTDESFGTSGVASVSIAPNGDTTSDVAVQSDGKILVAGTGYYGTGNYDFVLSRFNTDGTLDTDFSGDGKVNTDLDVNSYDELAGITVQSNGKILATGFTSISGVAYISAVRYNSDGSLDSSFDGDGKVFISAQNPQVEDGGVDIFVQSDGKIVIVGYGYDSVAGYSEPVVVRLFGNGQTDYIKVMDAPDRAAPFAAALQADGKIVFTGLYGSSSDNLGVWRVDANGNLDSSFGVAGAVINSHMSYANAVAVQADGKILIAGTKTTAGSWYNSVIHRYTTDGNLDPTFSSDGIFETSISDRNDSVNDLVVRNDGSVVVVGQAFVTSKDLSYVAQITPTGILDTRYSNDGFQIINVGSVASRSIGAALDNNGKLLMAAVASFGINGDLAVMRINPPSTISTLSALSVTGASLVESFSSSTTTYTATVTNTTASVTITPTTTHGNATVRVNGSSVTSGTPSTAISLAVGANAIPVVVTAQDGVSSTTYTISVTRSAAPVVDSSSGVTTGGATTTSPTTSTTVAATTPLTIKISKSITAKALLASRSVTLASTSKVVITVKTTSKKYCSVTGTKVRGVKVGSCTVVVAVTPKATKTVKKPKTTKTTVTLRVV